MNSLFLERVKDSQLTRKFSVQDCPFQIKNPSTINTMSSYELLDQAEEGEFAYLRTHSNPQSHNLQMPYTNPAFSTSKKNPSSALPNVFSPPHPSYPTNQPYPQHHHPTPQPPTKQQPLTRRRSNGNSTNAANGVKTRCWTSPRSRAASYVYSSCSRATSENASAMPPRN